MAQPPLTIDAPFVAVRQRSQRSYPGPRAPSTSREGFPNRFSVRPARSMARCGTL